MGLNVGIVRTAPEMFGEIDERFSPYGVECTSVRPDSFMDPSFLEQAMYDIVFVPLSCLDELPTTEWMQTLEEAAAYCLKRIVWVMSSSDKKNYSASLKEIVTVDELSSFIGAIKGLQSARPPRPSASPGAPSSGTLLNRFKKWVESETQMPMKEEPLRTVAPEQREAPVVRKGAPLPSENDIEVLRDYIRIKEDELNDVRVQLTMFEDENHKLLKEIEHLKNDKNILDRKLDTLRGRLLFLEEENESLRSQKAHELDTLRAEFKNKMERLAIAENTLREQELKFDDLRERVRRDLFSVQERERYLEARMEVLKRDTEILLHHKDEKILELQEIIRQFEFKTEAYQDSLQRYEEMDMEEQDRSKRIVRALKLATSLLDQEEDRKKDADIRKRQA